MANKRNYTKKTEPKIKEKKVIEEKIEEVEIKEEPKKEKEIDFNHYKVKAGDNIKDIAAKYNISWQELYARNKFIIGNHPDKIKEGQILKIR